MRMSFDLGRVFKRITLQNFGFRIERIRRSHLRRLDGFFKRMTPVATERSLVRVGGHGNGGYLLPDDLEGVTSCFSPGVSALADFEKDFVARGIKCYLADYSVERAPFADPLIAFEKKFLGCVNNDVFMTLDDWVGRCADPKDNELVLQMDIEGAEYEVLLSTPAALLKRFRIIVVEFHTLDALFQPMGFKLIDAAFQKLGEYFEIVHIHPNNCSRPVSYGRYSVPPVMEFTFLRKDRVHASMPARAFPHPLDHPNLDYKRDIPLPNCWYAA